MKKSLRILVVLSIAASSLVSLQPATALGAPYDPSTGNGDVLCGTAGFFTIEDKIVLSNSGCAGTANIPEGVLTINSYAFSWAMSVTTLVIPDSVTSIGYAAFYGNTSLTSLTIGSGLTTITEMAFSAALSLTTVSIPGTVRIIGANAFNDARVLTSLTIGNGVTSIGNNAFFEASRLTSVVIPNSVTTIGDNAFRGASGLTSLTIGNGVTSIGSYAFYNATSLTSLAIPNSVTSLGQGAFRSLSRLTSLTLGTGLTSISADAFAYPTALTSATIPSNVISIGSGAFFGATSLTSLTISSGVTSIGSGSFNGASSLTSLTIPSSVSSIGTFAFFEASLIASLTIPNGVTSIGAYSFTGTSSLLSYQYCGTSLSTTALSNAGLGSKRIIGCAPTITISTAPTSVVATATGKRSATVSFGAPTSNNGSAITLYTAISSPGGITKTLTQATGGTFNFDGLQPGTAYAFEVTATNAIGTSAAASSNLATTTPLVVASLSALSFVDDGNGTSGKIVWAGMNIDSVLYTGPQEFYPGPFNYGAFTGGWTGRIRNLTPNTTYDVSIIAHSADGVGGEKSLRFTTNVAPLDTQNIFDSLTGISIVTPLPALTDAEKLTQLLQWVDQNTYVTGEAARISKALTDFANLTTSRSSTRVRLPISSVLTIEATSLTPHACSVISPTADVDAGMVTALTTDKCTISYTVTGGSGAPATYTKDLVFTYFQINCGDSYYVLKAGVVSHGQFCTGEVTIDSTATSITPAAFAGSRLTSIVLPNSITVIPNYAFADTKRLANVELGNAVTSLGFHAFRDTGLVSISLPSSLRTLDAGVFFASSLLTSLTIPEGTTTVGAVLFMYSSAFTTVTIPTTVTYMQEGALVWSKVKMVYYCGNNASVLKAIFNASYPVRITPTCIAPALVP